MRDFHELAFFKKMNQGMCRRLRGKVLIELLHVSDNESNWTQQEKTAFFNKFQEAMGQILLQAHAANVSLSMSSISCDYHFAGIVDEYKALHVFEDYLKQRGMSERDYAASRKAAYAVDEVAVILVLEKDFRAYAVTNGETEYSVLSYKNDIHAICHELLHNFGAVDLYFPYYIFALTMRHFPKTVMCTYEGMEIDPLTQYLIGWKTVMDQKALAFITEAQDYTQERHIQANRLEWARGRESYLMENATPFNTLSELQTAANKSNVWAQFLLGYCYRDGILTEKNPIMAETYFRRSGMSGLTIASFAQLEMMLVRGSLTVKEKQQVLDIFNYCYYENIWQENLKLLCTMKGIVLPRNEKGAADSIIREYKRSGRGTPGNENQRALQLYRIALWHCSGIPSLYRAIKNLLQRYENTVQYGDPSLQVLMGQLMQQGKYVAADPQGAVSLFVRAASNGNYRACLELARCYQEGIGIARDSAQVDRWRGMAERYRQKNPWDAFSFLSNR